MPWYFYLLEFVSGLLLANGVPHFVQGVSGHRFQSPFGYPPGVGESSPLSNTLWGFANLAAGFILLRFFVPQGSGTWMDPGGPGRLACRGLAFHLFRQGARGTRREIPREGGVARSAQSFVKGFSIERLAGAEPRTARIMSMRARNVAGTCRCPG